MKIKAIAPYLIYLLINSIFIIKYTSRLNFFNEFLFALIYLVIIILIIYSYGKINICEYYYKYIFFIIGVTFFVFTIYLNININGNNLNVDRWSAMEVGIKALLNGQYPYSAIDHLRGRTSNLPSLIFIGIPFYLMGNIGYLQSFAFLIFSLIMYIAFNNYRDRLFCMLLLTLSPSYLWEVYVKSDLMSNFIFILFFLIVVQNKIIKDKKINPIILPFISTALVLTRLTVIIPISLLLFKKIYKYSLTEKVKFIVISLLTSIVFLYICFNKVNSFEHLKYHNPFELQNRQLPFIISLATILIPIFYSFYVNDIKSLITSSTFFLFLPVLIAFLFNFYYHGIYSSIFKSTFDVSYFNIVSPFLLVSMTFNHNKLLVNIVQTKKLS